MALRGRGGSGRAPSLRLRPGALVACSPAPTMKLEILLVAAGIQEPWRLGVIKVPMAPKTKHRRWSCTRAQERGCSAYDRSQLRCRLSAAACGAAIAAAERVALRRIGAASAACAERAGRRCRARRSRCRPPASARVLPPVSRA